jgi:hypothetical protein
VGEGTFSFRTKELDSPRQGWKACAPAMTIPFALMACLLLAGCVPPASVVYVPDPSAPIAGWKCPSDRQFIAHTNPPCTWIPGVVLTQNCHDQYVASINEARGCVPAPNPGTAAQPAPK